MHAKRYKKDIEKGKNSCLSQRLEDILKNPFKMSWRCLEEVLKDEKLLRWVHLYKKSSRYVLMASLSILGDQQMSPGNGMLTLV